MASITPFCPICYEDLEQASAQIGDIRDAVVCSQCKCTVHKDCLQKSIDVLQDTLSAQGHPLREHAMCPLCRKEQPLISAKVPAWGGELELSQDQLAELSQLLLGGGGFIQKNSVPDFIRNQMPNAHSDEICKFANVIATQTWLGDMNCMPKKMRFKQPSPGRFTRRLYF